eukprot:g319.t1
MASFLEDTAAAQDGVGGGHGKMHGRGDRGYDDVENVHAGNNDENDSLNALAPPRVAKRASGRDGAVQVRPEGDEPPLGRSLGPSTGGAAANSAAGPASEEEKLEVDDEDARSLRYMYEALSRPQIDETELAMQVEILRAILE